MPCATVTQTVPASLHSTHTLCPGTRGLRPSTSAVIRSMSCPRSIGQPRSSKSTGTWSAIEVLVASVSMKAGVA